MKGAAMTSTQEVVGSIVSVWRYPVKSMMGEELNAAQVTKVGLAGDRSYALVDTSDGKVASAKNPRKWPQLFDFRAALKDAPRTGGKGPPVRLTLPDGTIIDSDDPDVNRILSKALKRDVKLSASPDLHVPPRRSTGRISKDSTTGTRSPTSVCQRVRFSTAPSCIC